jgi:hypothetical protein
VQWNASYDARKESDWLDDIGASVAKEPTGGYNSAYLMTRMRASISLVFMSRKFKLLLKGAGVLYFGDFSELVNHRLHLLATFVFSSC